MILYNQRYSYTEIGKLLLVDDTAKRYIVKYINEDSLLANHKGKLSQLNESQTVELIEYLKETFYLSCILIVEYVKQYGIVYTASGMTAWLNANGFSYKKPKLLPKHVNVTLQESFITHMTMLKNSDELLILK